MVGLHRTLSCRILLLRGWTTRQVSSTVEQHSRLNLRQKYRVSFSTYAAWQESGPGWSPIPPPPQSARTRAPERGQEHLDIHLSKQINKQQSLCGCAGHLHHPSSSPARWLQTWTRRSIPPSEQFLQIVQVGCL